MFYFERATNAAVIFGFFEEEDVNIIEHIPVQMGDLVPQFEVHAKL